MQELGFEYNIQVTMIEVTLVLARGEKVFSLPEDFSGFDAAMMAAGIKLAGVQEFREPIRPENGLPNSVFTRRLLELSTYGYLSGVLGPIVVAWFASGVPGRRVLIGSENRDEKFEIWSLDEFLALMTRLENLRQ